MEINAEHVSTHPRLGIVINLDDLRSLMREFINEQVGNDKHLYEWRFETFLQWLQTRREIEEVVNEQA